jgi:hypothetical protein
MSALSQSPDTSSAHRHLAFMPKAGIRLAGTTGAVVGYL